jgi:hypothetical protein
MGEKGISTFESRQNISFYNLHSRGIIPVVTLKPLEFYHYVHFSVIRDLSCLLKSPQKAADA